MCQMCGENEHMKTIDLSKLSDKCRREIADLVQQTAMKQAEQIRADVEPYGEGPTKQKMLDWAIACDEVAKVAGSLHYWKPEA